MHLGKWWRLKEKEKKRGKGRDYKVSDEVKGGVEREGGEKEERKTQTDTDGHRGDRHAQRTNSVQAGKMLM